MGISKFQWPSRTPTIILSTTLTMAETDFQPDVPQKKRKRTGKEREERKRAAIQVCLGERQH